MTGTPAKKCTPAERRSSRRYAIELLGSMAVYALLLVVSLENVAKFPVGPAKTAVALLPMLGIVGVALALVRFTLRADELQRRTIVTSGAIAAIVTAVLTLGLDLLQNAGLPRPDGATTWVLICAVFGIALPFVNRRYR